MIQSQLHPCDEITAFGHSIHGLVTGNVSGYSVTVDEQVFALSNRYAVSWDTSILQIVKHPSPPELPDEVFLEAERLQGRVWQNYALKHAGGMFGQVFEGWIYIDGEGDRWLITPRNWSQATVGQGLSLGFFVRPFGYLDEPATPPVELTASLGSIGQVTTNPSPRRNLSLHTVNGAGTHAVIRLMMPSAVLPMGFLSVSVSGSGDDITIALSVLYSEVATLGEWRNNFTNNVFPRRDYQIVYSVEPAGVTPSYVFPAGGATVTWTPRELAVSSTLNGVDVLVTSLSAGRTGRLVALQYDQDDSLVVFSYDTDYAARVNYPDLADSAATFTGSLSITRSAPWGIEGQYIEGEVGVSVTRPQELKVTTTIKLKRDGAVVAEGAAMVEMSGSQTLEYSGFGRYGLLGYAGGNWNSGGGIIGLLGGSTSASWVHSMHTQDGLTPVSVTLAPSTWTRLEPSNLWGACGFPAVNSPRDHLTPQADLSAGTERIGWELTTQGNGARLNRVHRVGQYITNRAELALTFAHAELLNRGADVLTLPVAYHPVEHTTYVSTDPSIAAFYV